MLNKTNELQIHILNLCVQKLSCNSCPATFPMNQEDKLLAHMERMHQGKDRENVICADCGAQFKTQNQLKYSD